MNWTWLPLVILLCLCLTPRAGRAVVLGKEAVDAHTKALLDGEWTTGLVVGVLDETGPHVYGYGKTSREADGRSPDGDTVFEIGSLTKPFIAALLQQMVDKNELKMSDVVERFAPPGSKIPAFGGGKILFSHLASHTSGLPPLPGNLLAHDERNPYDDYSPRQMYEFLGRFMLSREPGERYENSHLGYALLGDVLAHKAGKPLDQALNERICQPLGLKDTRLTTSAEMKPRLAMGYSVDEEPMPAWTMEAMSPAMGMKSTANDLLKFAAANMGVTRTPLLDTLRATHVRQGEGDLNNDIAMAWQIARRFNSIWHNGQTGGYHSFISLAPGNKAAVVVLANSATPAVDIIGINLAKAIAGAPSSPAELRSPIRMTPTALQQYVGKYQFAERLFIEVTREGQKMYAQTTGQPRLRIYPDQQDGFFYRQVATLIDFERGPDGKVTGMVVKNGARALSGKRVADTADGSATPPPAPSSAP